MAATGAQLMSPFIKQMASSDKRLRDRAFAALQAYIRVCPDFDLEEDPQEPEKLWKGLFYCMWMSDKPRNQQQLARDLAELFNEVSEKNFLCFVGAFWSTMAREWNNIDRLRLDKFLYLIRCCVKTGFERINRGGWLCSEMIALYLAVLRSVPFNPGNPERGPKVPDGLRFHAIDVYVDELDKVDWSRTAPLDTLLEPLRMLRERTHTRAVKKRVTEALEDDRLKNWSKLEQPGNEDPQPSGGEEDEFVGFGE